MRQIRGSGLTLVKLAALGLLTAGCAGLPAPPTQLVPGTDPPTAGLANDAPARAVLRPGDTVTVELVSTPPRAYPQLQVSATGQLHVPGLGDVTVGGLTVAEGEARVIHRLRAQDRIAQVSLRHVSPDGGRVTVLGAVAQQGAFAVQPGMRITDAITAAGGPLTAPVGRDGAPVSLAALGEAVVTREGVRLPISIPRALEGDRRHDVYVHPGDHIHVPLREHSTVSVFGQVGGAGVLAHWDGMRLTEALALAGGVTADGDKSDIRVVRGPVEHPEVYSASLRAIVDGEGSDVTLAPGDVLFVTDEWLEDAREVLGVFAPLLTLASAAVLVAVVSSP